VILQGAPGKLSEETILRGFKKKGMNLSFQKAIVSKILWIPMRVGINE
jgi:hypothetical protein